MIQPRTRSWAKDVPGPIWAIVVALILSFVASSTAVWKTSIEVSETIKPMQADIRDIKALIRDNAAAFQQHQVSMHPIMLTTHQKDMEQLEQAFKFQQEFLKAEFGKVDSRLSRIENEVKKD